MVRTAIMKTAKFFALLALLTTWAIQGQAQTIGIVDGGTPVVGGSTGQCVTKGSNGAVLMASCTGSGVVNSWSGGTTGLTPSTATTGAVTAAGVLIGANGGTGVANTGKTITLGGNLTTTGAFNATFAIPGTGTWTFPVAGSSLAPLASPTFTGTVTVPTPFTLGAVSVTATGTQLNYLTAATGTTGTTSTNVVFSTSPTLVTPTLGVALATSINGNTITTGTGTLTLGSATLNAGAGGTLGSNAFTSTAYASLASPTFTGTVTHSNPLHAGRNVGHDNRHAA
jgi:hypothetical protein